MAKTEGEPKKQLSQEASNVLGGVLISSSVAIGAGEEIARGGFLEGGILGIVATAMAAGITIGANRFNIDLNK